jgi:hypothetical protein
VQDEHRTRELAADPARAAAILDVTPGRAASLLTSDERDVFIAKCKNLYDSPHAEPGEPCPSAVWECLFCRQRVVTATKLPKLLKLLDHIDGKARALTVEQWRGRYAAARAVIAERILPQFSDDVKVPARRRSVFDEDFDVMSGYRLSSSRFRRAGLGRRCGTSPRWRTFRMGLSRAYLAVACSSFNVNDQHLERALTRKIGST